MCCKKTPGGGEGGNGKIECEPLIFMTNHHNHHHRHHHHHHHYHHHHHQLREPMIKGHNIAHFPTTILDTLKFHPLLPLPPTLVIRQRGDLSSSQKDRKEQARILFAIQGPTHPFSSLSCSEHNTMICWMMMIIDDGSQSLPNDIEQQRQLWFLLVQGTNHHHTITDLQSNIA